MAEIALCKTAADISVDPWLVAELRGQIIAGDDPLGDAFSTLRSPDVRREHGATYTPTPIVQTMVDWAAATRIPCRVVDPGVGSARFLSRAGAMFPKAELVGIDVDPLAALMARANLAVTGYGSRAWVIRFIGNPAHADFYGKSNDRMTAFADKQVLNAKQIALLADWLRGEWYEAPKQGK